MIAIEPCTLDASCEALRAEVREFLATELADLPPVERAKNWSAADPAFSRKLGARGWLGVSWPREYGGQARSALEHLAFEEEMAYSEAPVTFHNTAATMIGPTLIRFGSPEQKRVFLPGIARGDISFALGYSEPDHGSDLAGIRTAATPLPEGGWRIRGQKIFTSTAGFSTHVWLAARTDPAQSRHRGISVFIVPLDAPGITLQPMSGINGHRSNIVFYDDVVVDEDALVGELHGGWEVITAALAFERVSLAAIAARSRGYFDLLLGHVQTAGKAGQPLAADSLVCDRIGQLAAQIQAARLLADHPDAPHYPAADGAVKFAAAWLIDQCGWKGVRRGDVGVHERQALVLVNHGRARADELLDLAADIEASVRTRFGVELEPEPLILR